MLELATIMLAVGRSEIGDGLASELGGGMSLGPILLRLVSSMALIFLLIFVMVFLFRRYGRNLSPQTVMGRHVTILGSYTIEAKKRIYLVRVFDRVILMGAGPLGLTALTEFDGGEVEDRLKAAAAELPRPMQDFRHIFRKLTANLHGLKGVETP